jgi:hypothetical protein
MALCVCQLMKQEGMGDVGVYHCVCVRVKPTVQCNRGFSNVIRELQLRPVLMPVPIYLQ